MSTATEQAAASAKDRAERVLDMRIKGFIARYEPLGQGERMEFHGELHAFVRAIYEEAQRPFIKAVAEHAMFAVNWPPTTIKTEGE